MGFLEGATVRNSALVRVRVENLRIIVDVKL